MFHFRSFVVKTLWQRNYTLMQIYETQHKIIKQVNRDIQKQQFMLEMQKIGLQPKKCNCTLQVKTEIKNK